MIDKNLRVKLNAVIPVQALSWRNDPEIYKWCRQYTALSPSHHANWLKQIEEDPKIKMFCIINKYDNEEIGVCGLTSIDRHNQTAEFSLYIARQKQKRGFGKDALLTLLAHGFDDFNLNRIWGESFDGNPALKMFDDIGMVREGCLRESYFKEGKFVNSIIVSMIRSDWNRRNGAF